MRVFAAPRVATTRGGFRVGLNAAPVLLEKSTWPPTFGDGTQLAQLGGCDSRTALFGFRSLPERAARRGGDAAWCLPPNRVLPDRRRKASYDSDTLWIAARASRVYRDAVAGADRRASTTGRGQGSSFRGRVAVVSGIGLCARCRAPSQRHRPFPGFREGPP